MTLGRDRDYLLNLDPDELVDVLRISSRELLDNFPEKVLLYLCGVDDEQDEEADYDSLDS